MLRRCWVRVRERRNRVLCSALRVLSTVKTTTVWTDHYTGHDSSNPKATVLYVSVQSKLNAYRFGSHLGIRIVIKVTEVVVTQHLLTQQMRTTERRWRYVGLGRSALFSLLRYDLPWLKELPDGRPGENRPYDRRFPKSIE